MANIKAKIKGTQDTITAKTVQVQAGDIKLGDLGDVNTQGQTDGAMMIFNSSTGKYEIKTEIQNENLNIIGGTY